MLPNMIIWVQDAPSDSSECIGQSVRSAEDATIIRIQSARDLFN